MSVDLYGWVEIRHFAPGEDQWRGLLRLDPLVGRAREGFALLIQPYPTTGPRAATYVREAPVTVSPEMSAWLSETGLEREHLFVVDWASLAHVIPITDGVWPHMMIELWWRDRRGQYQLKSPTHQLSRLSREEQVVALRGPGPFDKHQYRYVVREDVRPIELSAEWRTLFGVMRMAASKVGDANLRIVGSFG
ncbi:MAG: hypothetical protein HOW73_24165 [Polyangiaceae bacterium]|nr:hypothetical protein [Polyangiaceae bacterium]